MNAPACGTCGRPMPPMQQGAPTTQPAKTMFGYAAPIIAQQGAPQPPGARPGGPQPGGFAPPQAQGFGQPPPAQNPYGQPPPQANPYGQPPQAQNPYGQPPQAQNPYGQQPPQAQNPYGQPPQAQNPYGQQPPQAQNPYGQQPPQAQNPYGQPQQPPQAQNPYGQPQQAPQAQNPYGQAPQAQNPYGQAPQPQNPYGQAPQPANPYGATQPQPQNPYGQPQPQQNPYGQGDAPGPLDNIARGLPTSAPGTIFGIPVSMLRDASLQRKVLFFAGIALVASIVIPTQLSPFDMPLKHIAWATVIWPLVAGGAYLLVAAAPPHIREKVPPAVLQWIPFAVSYYGIFAAGGGGPGGGLYMMGYAVLVFGLLARIAAPADQTARIIIAVGAGMTVPGFIDILSLAFKFNGGVIFIVTGLLMFAVSAIGVLCIAFVVPPQKLPPALRPIDSLAPVFAAVLLAWLPTMVVLIGLGRLVHAHQGIGAILTMVHMLIPIVAFFGVLMMAAPAAYEEAMRMFKKGPQAPPPQGGGYPPQGGGYPPQGGGYPPQGGGYPPQGGGYPPQGGGGWQQQ